MWFKFNPSQLLRRWPYRSLENFGAYCTLYCLAWDVSGLPDDPQEVANISGLPLSHIEQVWAIFRQHSTTHLGKLMPIEMVEGLQVYKGKAEAGKRSVEKRWNKVIDGNKGVTDTVPITHLEQTYNTPNTDLDKDLDKKRTKVIINTTEMEGSAEGNASKSSPSLKSNSRTRKTELTDEEWLDSLQARECYKEIGVRMLYAKMLAWCELKGKKPTRARLLNWLNREEKPMHADFGTTQEIQNARPKSFHEQSLERARTIASQLAAYQSAKSGSDSAEPSTSLAVVGQYATDLRNFGCRK